MKMQKKLIIAIVVSVILPTLTVAIVSISKTTSQAKENFISATQNEIRQVENGFILFFEQVKSNTKFLAQHPAIRAVPEETNKYMGAERIMDLESSHPIEAEIHQLFTSNVALRAPDLFKKASNHKYSNG